MKCIFCPAELDETTAPAGQLEEWKQLRVVTHAGGELTLFQGHACPKHNLQGDSLSLSFKYEPPPVDVTSEATETNTPAPSAAPADDVRIRTR